MNRHTIVGVIERRLLINYRAEPDVVAPLLPSPLRPQLVDGSAVVGLCLVRLAHTRPPGWPRLLGLRSENAAHRIAVEWDGREGMQCGVFIVRRDSASLASVAAGGRLYPGIHRRASFAVDETLDNVRVRFESTHDAVAVDVEVEVADELGGSLFRDTDDASRFFKAGSIGLSPSRSGALEGWTLQSSRWSMQPVSLSSVQSSFFDDRRRFPIGSIELDSGVLMRDIPVRWERLQIPAELAARNDTISAISNASR